MPDPAAASGGAGGGGERTDYPFVQVRDDVALVGVTSSVATGDLGAWGRSATPQLVRLEALPWRRPS